MLFDIPEFGPTPDQLNDQFEALKRFADQSKEEVIGRLAWQQARQRAEVLVTLGSTDFSPAQIDLFMGFLDAIHEQVDSFVRFGVGAEDVDMPYIAHPMEEVLDDCVENAHVALVNLMSRDEEGINACHQIAHIELSDASAGDLVELVQGITASATPPRGPEE